jgi:hypothetical protein
VADTLQPAAVAAVGPAGTPPGTPRRRPHVLVLGVSRRRRRGIVDDVRYILDTGSQVTLVCTRASQWPEFESQVAYRELAAAEARHPLLRAERAVVFTAPALPLRYAAALFRRLQRLPRAARPASTALARIEHARRRCLALGEAFHDRLFTRGYRVARPWVLWRSARTSMLPDLDLDAIDLVLLADAEAVAIGWHLARAHPDLPVVFSLDRSALPPVLP